MKQALLWGLIFLVLFPLSLSAQTEMTLQDIADYALINSREIERAVDDAKEAAENLAEVFTLDNTRFTVEADYSLPLDSLLEGDSYSANSSISVPIIPQIGVSARVTYRQDDEAPEGSLGLTLSPFASNADDWSDWRAQKIAENQIADFERQVPWDAEKKALDVLAARQNLVITETSLKLSEDNHEVNKKRYELSDISFTELEDSRSEMSAARKQYFDTQRTLLSEERALYQVLGPELGEIIVAPLNPSYFDTKIDSMQRRLAENKNPEPISLTLANSLVEQQTLTRQMDQTPKYEPELSVSLDGSYRLSSVSSILTSTDPVGFFAVRPSVSFTLSPAQFHTEERQDISENLQDALIDIKIELYTLSLEEKMLKKVIEVANQALEVNENDLDQAAATLEEERYLHQLGERTDLELREAELNVESLETRVFSASLELYKSLGDLLLLYGEKL